MADENIPGKKAKKKGPIRLEAVVPFVVFSAAIYVYTHFFFDHNIKSLIEYFGYEALGAEVNVGAFETSFWKFSVRVQNIEITNSEKPQVDVVKIGDIRSSLLWDGLLRARIVVNEMAVESIEFNVPRIRPGKVKPPEPPKPKTNGPSTAEKEFGKAKNSTLTVAEEQFNGNIFGDLATLLKSGPESASLGAENFPSKAKLEALQKNFQERQTKWNEKLKTLPQNSEIQALGDRIKNVKTNNFKSPAEIQNSLKEISDIFQEADKKIKTVQGLSDEFNHDYRDMETQYKEVDALVKKDIASLQNKMKIPAIDAASLTKAVFMNYLKPYFTMFYRYQNMAEKYLPASVMTKIKGRGEKEPGEKSASAAEIKPHPRAKGTTYEFGHPNAYPLFWIKKVLISSQAGQDPYTGNVSGKIENISSNQSLSGPTLAHITGDFPKAHLEGFELNLKYDDGDETAQVDATAVIKKYLVESKIFVQSDEAHIGLKNATGSLQLVSHLTDFKSFEYNIETHYSDAQFDVGAKNDILNGILADGFRALPQLYIKATGKGELPSPSVQLESNLGSELQRSLEKQLQKRIDEAKQKLQAAVEMAIGKQKKEVEGQLNSIKSQVDSATAKVNESINAEKKMAQSKADQSKNGASGAVNQKAQDEAKKAADKLKSALGL